MRENIANALEISVDDVSVKATTEEKLGFTGAEPGDSSACSMYNRVKKSLVDFQIYKVKLSNIKNLANRLSFGFKTRDQLHTLWG